MHVCLGIASLQSLNSIDLKADCCLLQLPWSAPGPGHIAVSASAYYRAICQCQPDILSFKLLDAGRAELCPEHTRFTLSAFVFAVADYMMEPSFSTSIQHQIC